MCRMAIHPEPHGGNLVHEDLRQQRKLPFRVLLRPPESDHDDRGVRPQLAGG